MTGLRADVPSGEIIVYRPMTEADTGEVSTMVARVFSQFLAEECADGGVEEFARFIAPEQLRDRLASGQVGMVADISGQIVGAICFRDCGHVSLLFVAPEHHRRGIARELLGRGLAVCRAARPSLAYVTVNSSGYAVEVYERLGFRATGSRQLMNGISFVPMVLDLTSKHA